MRGFKVIFFGMVTLIFHFFSDLRAFEQHSRFRALCNLFRAMSPSPQVRRCQYAHVYALLVVEEYTLKILREFGEIRHKEYPEPHRNVVSFPSW